MRILAALSLLGVACGTFGDSGTFTGGGGYGATAGGVKDIRFARELIAGGQVPPADAITVEGLLSEHDLPALGPPCDELMCLRPALGVAPSLETGKNELWLHLGMVSGLKPGFRRPPLDVVAVIDKSSSMGIDMTETTESVARMIDKLRDDDRISVIAFDGEVHELYALAAPGDREALKAEVRGISAGGNANLMAGTERGVQIARSAGGTGRLRRVMVWSCGNPSVSPERGDPFSQLVQLAARDGVGISFFGVLLGYFPALGELLGKTPGGAYYYLNNLDDVKQVFDTDFDPMVTPLAYDLSIGLEAAGGVSLARFYGVPGAAVGDPKPQTEVATAFLSNRRGALVARLSLDGTLGQQVGKVHLSYRPESALGFSNSVSQDVSIAAPADLSTQFASVGVRKSVALVNQAERMRAACSEFAKGSRSEAVQILDQLIMYLNGEATALADAGLATEVELVTRLRANAAR